MHGLPSYTPLLDDNGNDTEAPQSRLLRSVALSFWANLQVERLVRTFSLLVAIACSFFAGVNYGRSLEAGTIAKEVISEGSQRLVPSFSVEARKFHFDKLFADASLNDAERVWSSMIPKGRGWIRLPIVNEYDSTEYNIAAYHQLHCLFALRRDFYSLLSHASSSEVEGSALNTTQAQMHGNHCFEYLRNALTCNADLTLEPYIKGTKVGKVWDVSHKCIDFESLSKWATLVRATDDEGISAEALQSKNSDTLKNRR